MPTTKKATEQKERVFNTIQETRNLGQFHVLQANRDLKNRHVDDLVKSLEENGNFLASRPILVNENYEVVDGQHRLAAAKELKIPVFYTVVPGLRVADARNMNILQRNWNMLDYLDSYADEGRAVYRKLRALHEQYPEVALSILTVYAQGYYRHGIGSRFRKGDFEDFDIDEAKERLDHLTELASVNDVFLKRTPALALLNMIRSPEYDSRRMLQKVIQNGGDLAPYHGMVNNLRKFEELYNHKLSEENRVRFF